MTVSVNDILTKQVDVSRLRDDQIEGMIDQLTRFPILETHSVMTIADGAFVLSVLSNEMRRRQAVLPDLTRITAELIEQDGKQEAAGWDVLYRACKAATGASDEQVGAVNSAAARVVEASVQVSQAHNATVRSLAELLETLAESAILKSITSQGDEDRGRGEAYRHAADLVRGKKGEGE